MTPILRKGDKVHFSVCIATTVPGGRVGPDEVLNAKKDAVQIENMLRFHGVETVGWTANTGILAPQINFILREEPDA